MGAAGVGKTRTVLEALEHDSHVADRVLVDASAEHAYRLLTRESLLDHFPDLILAVDDIDIIRGESLVTLFNTEAQLRPR